MGDPKGFINVKRREAGYRPVEERVNDYSEVEKHLPDDARRLQASRCMDCGVPFCHWACPVSNVMPEFQDRVYRGDWKGAYDILQETNNFPEFTGRICPALCEASCVLAIGDDAVTIRQNELAVIEKAFSLGTGEAAAAWASHREDRGCNRRRPRGPRVRRPVEQGGTHRNTF